MPGVMICACVNDEIYGVDCVTFTMFCALVTRGELLATCALPDFYVCTVADTSRFRS